MKSGIGLAILAFAWTVALRTAQDFGGRVSGNILL